MTILETLLSPPFPSPITFIEAAVAASLIYGCIRFRKKSTTLDQQHFKVLFIFCISPFLATSLFGFLHAWSVFGASEITRGILLRTAFYSSYNIAIGLIAFILNATMTFMDLRKLHS